MTTFHSHKYSDLELIRIAEETIRNERGKEVGVTGPKPGESPWRVKFKRGIFETEDETLIEFLREHRFNGIYFIEQGIDEPKPTVSDQLDRIMRAQTRANLEEIRAAVEEEKSTHNRDVVLQAAETAVRSIAEPEGSADSTGSGDEGDTPSNSPLLQDA